MTTFSAGGTSPEFEKLIQLATFIQTPDYLQRVKDLKALEASSKAALDQANAAIAEASAAKFEHNKREAAIKQKEEALAKEQAAHRTRVAALAKALGEAR